MSALSIANQITTHHHAEGISDESVYRVNLSESYPYRIEGWEYVGPREDRGGVAGHAGYVTCRGRGMSREDLAALISDEADSMRARIPGYAARRAAEQEQAEYVAWMQAAVGE